MRSTRGGARAQHLEDHDGIADDLEGRIKTGANHHSVRVATAIFRRLDLEVAAEELARLSAQPASERQRKIALNGGVGEASACHCDGLDAVEFVAQFLPLFPCEEFGERHRLFAVRFMGGRVARLRMGVFLGFG